MNALHASAYNILNLGMNIACGEVVGKYNKTPTHTGALIGIVNFSIHNALEPMWTAVKISAGLNPLGNVLLSIFRIAVEAVFTTLAMDQVFKHSAPKATLVNAEVGAAAAICKLLTDAAIRSLRV
jgi:hypothetical protein